MRQSRGANQPEGLGNRQSRCLRRLLIRCSSTRGVQSPPVRAFLSGPPKEVHFEGIPNRALDGERLSIQMNTIETHCLFFMLPPSKTSFLRKFFVLFLARCLPLPVQKGSRICRLPARIVCFSRCPRPKQVVLANSLCWSWHAICPSPSRPRAKGQPHLYATCLPVTCRSPGCEQKTLPCAFILCRPIGPKPSR